jgi:opacity protein-like surface antigen
MIYQEDRNKYVIDKNLCGWNPCWDDEKEAYVWYDATGADQTYGNAMEFSKTSKGWNLTWNISAGFSYQLSPSTYLDFSYRYVDYGQQKLPQTIPSEVTFPVVCQVENCSYPTPQAYASGSGQTIRMNSQQAVLSLRFDLGAGEQAIAEYNRKKEGALSFFDGVSGPGPLDGPAIKPGSFTISPRLGRWFPDTDLGLSKGSVTGLGLGYNFTRNWGLEASLDMTSRLSSNFAEFYTGSARLYSARLNAVYNAVDPEDENSRWVPYATAGLGRVWSKGEFEDHEVDRKYGCLHCPVKHNQPTGDYSSFAINGGLGVKYFLHENVALRLEALDIYSFKNADFGRDSGPYHNIAVTGGLVFQFGGN